MQRRTFLFGPAAAAAVMVPRKGLSWMREARPIDNERVHAKFADWRQATIRESELLLTSNEPHIRRWREAMQAIGRRQTRETLEQVNQLVNSLVTFVDDYQHYREHDVWARVSQTLIEGGDCEDYALTKSATLNFLGWPNERLHLLVGYINRGLTREVHAVLAAETPERQYWLLDNLTPLILPPSHSHFEPVYGVNDARVWLFGRN